MSRIEETFGRSQYTEGMKVKVTVVFFLPPSHPPTSLPHPTPPPLLILRLDLLR